MTVIKVVHFVLQRHLKKTKQDILHDKDAMKMQSSFNLLSKVGLTLPLLHKQLFASTSVMKRNREKLF